LDSVIQHFGNPEVSYLDDTLLGNENVLAFKVSVKNLTVVDVLHAQTDLCEPVENLIFSNRLAALLFDLIL
jgi:hypothetical protein